MSKTLIRFNAGSDILSALIRWKTGSKWNHVDFLLPSGDLLGAVPGIGVVIHKVGAEKAFATYEISAERGWEYAATQIGKPYDFGAVLGLGLPFPRDFQQDDSWFCSELVCASLLHAGLPVISSDAWGVSPRDLLLSPLLKRI